MIDTAKLREIASNAFVVVFMDEGGGYIADGAASQIVALIDELEKAREERDDAVRQFRGAMESFQSAEALRDSARALLVSCQTLRGDARSLLPLIDAELEK